MCGRFPQPLHYQQFCRSVTPQLPHQRPPRTAKAADNYHASYNVAPNSNVAVVRAVLPGERTEEILQQTDQSQDSEEDVERSDPACREDAMSETPELMIQSMRWGFLPHYQKTPPEYKDTLNTINARSDVLLEGSPMWGRPFANGRRCVVFTQGFFEWQKSRGTNLPHFVGMDRSGQGRKAKDGTEKMMMPLAGLWEKCHIQGEEAPRYTFTIVTTNVCDELSFLHDRQPLILESTQAIALWLNPTVPLKEVRKAIKTFQGPFEFYKVPKEVGKVCNDDSAFIMPVEQREDGLTAAFSKGAGRGAQRQSVPDREQTKEADSSSATYIGAGPQTIALSDTDPETNAPAPLTEKHKIKSEQSSDGGTGASSLTEGVTVKHIDRFRSGVDESGEAPQGSSRFSPDPFDPPVSPYRPNGGYSTVDDPHGGLPKHGSVSHDDWKGAGKRKGSSKRIRSGEGALEEAFNRQIVKRELQEDVKNFQIGADGGVPKNEDARNTVSKGAPLRPKANPGLSNAFEAVAGSSTRRGASSKAAASPTKKDSSRSEHSDIRSYFGKK